MPNRIHLKRAYEPPQTSDGLRVLVERLWPRGLTKARANIDLWLKEIAPSPELRKWFGHDVAKWGEFRKRYAVELRRNAASLQTLRRLAAKGRVTLIYAARDPDHNSALLVKQAVERRGNKPRRRRPASGRAPARPRHHGD